MAFAVSRKALAVNAVATPSGKRAAVSRVVPRAALNDNAPKMFRESGADAPAMATTGAPTPVLTPFDNYRFAPIREATVRKPPVPFHFCPPTASPCVAPAPRPLALLVLP